MIASRPDRPSGERRVHAVPHGPAAHADTAPRTSGTGGVRLSCCSGIDGGRVQLGGAMDAQLVWRSGKVVDSAGDISTPIVIRSVRKSILSLLFGIAVDRGQIDVRTSLSDLDVNDRQPLTELERTATVEDLLQSRSGITHPATAEPASLRDRPERGTFRPGQHWWYNNWDFNALGSIYGQATGQSVFQGFVADLAVPLKMQDVSDDGDRPHYDDKSIHPAYHLAVSARDLMRVGQLVLAGGRWGSSQIVPLSWVERSTAALTPGAQFGLDYGYMWWSGSHLDHRFTLGIGGGNLLAIVPDLDLVVVQTQHAGRPGWEQSRVALAQAMHAASGVRSGP